MDIYWTGWSKLIFYFLIERTWEGSKTSLRLDTFWSSHTESNEYKGSGTSEVTRQAKWCFEHHRGMQKIFRHHEGREIKARAYFGGPSLPEPGNGLYSSLGDIMSNWMGASGMKPPSAGVEGGVGGPGTDRPLDSLPKRKGNVRGGVHGIPTRCSLVPGRKRKVSSTCCFEALLASANAICIQNDSWRL